jgi:hypothetical protein
MEIVNNLFIFNNEKYLRLFRIKFGIFKKKAVFIAVCSQKRIAMSSAKFAIANSDLAMRNVSRCEFASECRKKPFLKKGKSLFLINRQLKSNRIYCVFKPQKHNKNCVFYSRFYSDKRALAVI